MGRPAVTTLAVLKKWVLRQHEPGLSACIENPSHHGIRAACVHSRRVWSMRQERFSCGFVGVSSTVRVVSGCTASESSWKLVASNCSSRMILNRPSKHYSSVSLATAKSTAKTLLQHLCLQYSMVDGSTNKRMVVVLVCCGRCSWYVVILCSWLYACTDEDSNACRSCNATASLRLLVSMNEVKF